MEGGVHERDCEIVTSATIHLIPASDLSLGLQTITYKDFYD